MKIPRNWLGLTVALAILALGGLIAVAQQEEAAPPVRLLVVDETKTFLSTMRVGAFVGVLKGTGIFSVDVRFADVTSSWDDPLAGLTPEPDLEPYDIVLVIPLGIDDATVDWVMVVTDGLAALPPSVLGGLGLIGQVVDGVFEGNVRTIGIYDHLLVALLHGVYLAEGWMR